MKKYVAYYRVSTRNQAERGFGLDAQRAVIQKFLRDCDGVVIQEFQDVVSGSVDARTELSRAIQLCRSEGATLVIAKLDRLARKVSFIANLMECGVPLKVAEMPEANKMMLHMLAVVAETERDMISDRTRAALRVAKERGVKLGNPRIHEAAKLAEAARVRKADAFADKHYDLIRRERDSGKSFASIAAELNASGVQTSRGGQWWPTTVKNTLSRGMHLIPLSLM